MGSHIVNIIALYFIFILKLYIVKILRYIIRDSVNIN